MKRKKGISSQEKQDIAKLLMKTQDWKLVKI